MTENIVSESGAVGIAIIGDNNRVSRNSLTHNNGHGIYVEGEFNTIDENSALHNEGVGIDVVVSGKNTVVRNSALGNVNGCCVQNYFIVIGNNFGPIGAASRATNPWANTE